MARTITKDVGRRNVGVGVKREYITLAIIESKCKRYKNVDVCTDSA